MPQLNLNNLGVFIHVAVMNNWETLLNEILEACRISGLLRNAQVHLVSVGGQLESKYDHCKVINTNLTLNNFEYPTLSALYDYASKYPDGAVCYCHLKGVSQPYSIDHRRWRQELIDFVLVDWTIRINHLNERWSSGARITNGGSGWHHEHVSAYKHYSGNFWWARSDYINQLSSPDKMFASCRNRMGAEAWIGQSPKMNELIQ